MLPALERDDLLRLLGELVQPEVLLVLAAHLHTLYQQGHQLRHRLRLGYGDQDLGLFQQLDLESNAPPLREDLAEVLVVGDPVALHELTLEQEHAFGGLLVGVGGEAERQVLEVEEVVLQDGSHEELLDLQGRLDVHGKSGD